MTEMVYGTVSVRAGEPVLPKWWQTVDKWSLSCILMLFGIGIWLGFAASVPLAERNGLPNFYYVQRQLVFGGTAMVVMVVTSMLNPVVVRRLAVLGFLATLIAVMLLPVLGTDFGKGAVRW
jgi:cell division protein FtsW